MIKDIPRVKKVSFSVDRTYQMIKTTITTRLAAVIRKMVGELLSLFKRPKAMPLLWV